MSRPARSEHPPVPPVRQPGSAPAPGGAGQVPAPSGPLDELPGRNPALSVLAERIGASLANHEPGWRLPRVSELARRHNVGIDEVHAAVEQLIARQLVRRSADGQLYRASPAEYLVSVDGLADMSAVVDPMGRELTCLSYGMVDQAAAEPAARALGVLPGTQLGVLRLAWAVDGAPAAISTSYLARHAAQTRSLAPWIAATAGRGVLPLAAPTGEAANRGESQPQGPSSRPEAVSVQLSLPPVSVSRRLRLRPGQLAILVTVLTGTESATGPAALTVTVLRPDMFSVNLVTAAPPVSGAAAPDDSWSLASAEYPW
ncbi:MAG TPA: hypothetical protein VFO01_17860 [Trebonia sp.]|nr:hypothetical protein [Trebonia sp.]